MPFLFCIQLPHDVNFGERMECLACVRNAKPTESDVNDVDDDDDDFGIRTNTYAQRYRIRDETAFADRDSRHR